MHEQLFFVSDLPYGSDGHNLFPRLDIVENSIFTLEGTELRINVKTAETSHSFTVALTQNQEGIEAAQGKICELRLALAAMGIPAGYAVKFQLSLWQGGLSLNALPLLGWIESSTSEPADRSI